MVTVLSQEGPNCAGAGAEETGFSYSTLLAVLLE
jgi:hypothetical protein